MENKNDFAEFVGIMLGDGCLSHNRIQITLDSRNREYINYVCKLLRNLFDVNVITSFRKNENTCDVRVFNKKLIKILLEEKSLILSPKWGRAKIPRSIFETDLIIDALRGYFDTDGCVTITNNNGTIYPRIEMKVCPSPMQSQFIEGLKRYGFRFGVYQIGKGKVRIQLNGKVQLYKWFKLIGSKNASKVERFHKMLNAKIIR
jgi:hypothetical protein